MRCELQRICSMVHPLKTIFERKNNRIGTGENPNCVFPPSCNGATLQRNKNCTDFSSMISRAGIS
jgi:hypothetical protein